MKGDPHDFMRVGLVHFMAYPRVMGGAGPVLDSLRALCQDDYFQLIEVTRINRHSVRARAREMVRSSGKSVAFCGQPVLVRNGLDLSEANPRERTATLDAVKEIMAEAVEWQALFFELVSGPDPGEQGRKGAIARLVSSLKELCEASRTAKGPAVLLESFDRQPYAKNRLIGATQDAVQVARAVASYYPRFGLLLDLSHLPLLSESPPDAVAKAADYLKHVHIGNCVTRYPDHPAYGDEHPPFGIEEGENGPEQLAAFLRALLDVGYLREGSPNAVSFDVKPLKQEDVGKVLDSCKKTFEAAWRMV